MTDRRIRRGLLIALGAGALPPRALFAQDGRIWRVGFLAARSRPTPSHPDVYYDAFVDAMRELGYRVGGNLAIEWRFADGDYARFPTLARELVAIKVDVLVTHLTAATRALQDATSAIPIVCSALTDPVEGGFAVSLARPGRNITGLSSIAVDANSKRYDLLRAMLPNLSVLAVLLNPGNPSRDAVLKSVQQFARPTGAKVIGLDARTSEDIERAFSEMTRQGVQALMVTQDAFFFGQARKLADLTARHRLPSIFGYSEYAEAGGLMSYGQNATDLYRRIAVYVDKILRGAKAGDLPIEQPTRFEFLVNRRTAKALALTIPTELLVRADKIIE